MLFSLVVFWLFGGFDFGGFRVVVGCSGVLLASSAGCGYSYFLVGFGVLVAGFICCCLVLVGFCCGFCGFWYLIYLVAVLLCYAQWFFY